MKYLFIILLLFVCGCSNESTPRIGMFESMREACDGDSNCVRDSAARSFPYGDCTHPCREKYGRHDARYCRERCIVLQRELLDEGGVHPTEADWTEIWAEQDSFEGAK